MSVCVCVSNLALVFAHANRNLSTPRYRHLWPLWLYNIFSTPRQKRHDCGKQFLQRKTCVLIYLANLFKTYLILRRIQRKCTDVFM